MKKILLLPVFMAACTCLLYSQGWETIGALKFPRYFHQVERIGDTKLIVIGGSTAGGVTRECEVIDAVDGSISLAAPMNYARTLFGSVTLPDGRIVVAGGAKEVEVYTPSINQWNVVGELIQAYEQSCLTMIDDHRFIIIGGWSTSRCEIFDINTNTSMKVADFPYVTSQAKAFTTQDGRIFCFSGRSGGPGSFRSSQVHEYLPQTNQWVVAGHTPGSIYYPTITRTHDDRFIWTGGSELEGESQDKFVKTIASFSNGVFSTIGQLNAQRSGHGCVDLRNNTVLAVGGMGNGKNGLTSCEVVDLNTGLATAAPTLNVARGYFTARECVVDCEVRVFAISGSGGGSTLSSNIIATVEMLRLNSNSQVVSATMTSENSHLLGVAKFVGNTLFLTDNAPSSAGSAWTEHAVPVVESFETTFSFKMNKGADNGSSDGGSAGADGIAFLLQKVNSGFTGKTGGGVGYADGPHSLAIEFDSYQNDEQSDPSSTHIAVQVGNGSKIQSDHKVPYLRALVAAGVPRLRANNSLYYVKISYDGELLSVWFDTTGAFEEPTLIIPFDIREELDLGQEISAYAGLTSSTGTSVETHEVVSWIMTDCSARVSGIGGDDSDANPLPFQVNPNAASDHAELVFSNAIHGPLNIEVIDVSGSIVWTTFITESTLPVSIPVYGMSNGSYIVRVSNNVHAWSSRFSIVK